VKTEEKIGYLTNDNAKTHEWVKQAADGARSSKKQGKKRK